MKNTIPIGSRRISQRWFLLIVAVADSSVEISWDTAYTRMRGTTAHPISVSSFETSGTTYMNDRSVPSAKSWLRRV